MRRCRFITHPGGVTAKTFSYRLSIELIQSILRGKRYYNAFLFSFVPPIIAMADIPTNRQDYSYFKAISTRWIDNDVYGHVNNAVYYTYFDTVCNSYLIEHCGFNIQSSPVIGFVVASSCQYVSPLVFPDTVVAAMRVNRIGNSSVEYGVGLFRNDEDSVSAHGTFTHVFVNRETSKPVTIPDTLRNSLSDILRT